jgi:phosphoribosyl 1,2-cyclic phosphodiesterase
MRIRFWGVRGSLPSPQISTQIQGKVAAIIAQMTPADLESTEAREQFLSTLPPWLSGTVGGNTACVSVSLSDDSEELIVFDAGSGIRELGLAAEAPKISGYHLFFSHFHWDHIMGLPFFNPAFDPSVTLDFYSPKKDLERNLASQMLPPYFPITMDVMGAAKRFHVLPEETDRKVDISGAGIFYKKMNHPGDSYAYQVNDGRHRFIYATDVELSQADFAKNDENALFFQGADLIVIDSQYTLKDAVEKYNWGHSSFSLVVDFAAHWSIKQVVLFHHEPTYDDRKLYNILQSACWYAERMRFKGIKITLATEGLVIAL